MKIETKFNIGEGVFFLQNGNVESDNINTMNIHVNDDMSVEPSYFFFDAGRRCTLRKENELFKSESLAKQSIK